MKRFQNPDAERANEEWKAITTRTFTDAELEDFDTRIQAKHNGLMKIKDIEAFYVTVGAARWSYFGRPPEKNTLTYFFDKDNPNVLAIERVDNKIKQWQQWRAKKFPRQRLQQYDEMARRAFDGKRVMHHSDTDAYIPPAAPDPLASEFPDEPPV